MTTPNQPTKCAKHFDAWNAEFEKLGAALTARRDGSGSNPPLNRATLDAWDRALDARDNMMNCPDCAARYRAVRAAAP